VGWFERLWAFLSELQPIRIVRSYEQGVYFRNGQISRWRRWSPEMALHGGVYAIVPFFDAIETVNCQEDALDLPIQSITTTDGKQVSLSANVIYRVTDAVLWYTAVRDFDENIQRLATRHIMSKVRDWSWADLCAEQKELEKSLRGTLGTKAARWGVEVLDCGFDTLVQARQYRLFGGLG
jgi:regulator of protease activity HflC (stomatin/prohibitin superfamily)